MGMRISHAPFLFQFHFPTQRHKIPHILPLRGKHMQPRERGVARIVPTDENFILPFRRVGFDFVRGDERSKEKNNKVSLDFYFFFFGIIVLFFWGECSNRL
jgi:hypothetical protein